MSFKSGFSVEISVDLLTQAKAGNINAFEAIYQTYSGACYALAWRVTGQEALAQEVVQESFIKVFRKIQQYRLQGPFAGWLRQIVVREAIDKIKLETKLGRTSDEELAQTASNDLFDFNWLESCIALEQLTQDLSVTSRAVLFLHEVEGFSHNEIGVFFNKSASFSKVTLSRAYKSLKQRALKQELNNAFK
ncbi:RNA polymerase sigma factor [Thalassotalea sp. ND16A]|uniref:RNA polymerase sigma factor n=1 Tax=Thalassotalea sp. ND16A TaxID=1535422 RepID=UPI00051A0BFD|nr:RNA polymerase sigma factor [Thalassotalea sp. ND16A]KGJ98035.1 RNA polymerase, sigma-24 subunit, ECF subfamily [Thalassotalea sp. ND16A]